MRDTDGHAEKPQFQPAPAPSVLERIRLAASFLTILPILDRHRRTPQEVAASFGFFPLIGFAIGATLALVDYLLAGIGAAARSVLLISALVIVTGALHLDGLADTADALGAGRQRDRALAIMRDSRIGSFGAIALFLALALKIAALSGAAGVRRRHAIYLAPGLARWAMVIVAYKMPYLREGGAGTALLSDYSSANLGMASLLALGGSAIVPGWSCLRAAALAIGLAAALRGFFRRWLGGVTGDVLGAAAEIVETAVIVAIAS